MSDPSAPVPGPTAWDRPLALVPLVFLDLETTGLDAGRHEVIEIGAIRVVDGQEQGVVESLVRPVGPIPPDAARIHGITPAMVASAPDFRQAVTPLLMMLEGAVAVAHNTPFDGGFLAMALEREGMSTPSTPMIDTVVLARTLLPRLGSHKLDSLCRHLAVGRDRAHRALGDARALASVFARLVEAHLARPAPGPTLGDVAGRAGAIFELTDFGPAIPLARAEDRALLRWAARTGQALTIQSIGEPGRKSRDRVVRSVRLETGPPPGFTATLADGRPISVGFHEVLAVRRA